MLRAFAAFAWANRRAIDSLVITGDLSTTGSRRDLVAAPDLFTTWANGPSVLTAGGQPTLHRWYSNGRLDVLPGNHDRYRTAPRLYRPGGTKFDTVFGTPQPPLWTAKQGHCMGVLAQKGKTRLHILGADFTLQKKNPGKRFYWLPGWLGQGRVRPGLLAALVKETKSWHGLHEGQGCNVANVWLIHFDPFSTDATLQLLDSNLLVQAAKDACVSAILCGHAHESKTKPLSGSTIVFACRDHVPGGHASQRLPGHRVRHPGDIER